MALVKSILLAEIRKINDPEYVSFEGFPVDSTESATRWSAAIKTYASTVVPVATPASMTLAAAAMAAIIVTITAAAVNGVTQLPISFTNFAVQVALGMLPAFVGTPPPVPIDFSSVYSIGNAGGTSEDCANEMANVIDAWFKTGTAVPSGGGATINWS